MPSAVRSISYRRLPIRIAPLLFVALCLVITAANATVPIQQLSTPDAVYKAARIITSHVPIDDPARIKRIFSRYLAEDRNDHWATSGETWLALRVRADSDQQWVAHVHNMLAQQLDLWVYRGSRMLRHARSGMALAVQRTPALDIAYRLPFRLPSSGVYTLLLRLRGPMLEQPVMSFVSAANEAASAGMRRLGVLLAFGVLLGFAMFNLAQGVVARDATYLWYAAYACAVIASFASAYGLLAEFLHIPDPHLHLNRAAIILHFTFGLFFAYRLLDIGQRHGRLRPFFVALGTGFGVLLVLTPFFEVIDLIPYLRLLILMQTLFLLSVGIYSAQHGYQPARYYTLGWVVLLLAAIHLLAALVGWNSFSYQDVDWMLYASVFELMMFSLALGDRVRTLVVEKSAAEAATRAQSAFISNMSHEIRTPLTAIIGGADLLQRDILPEQAERNVKAIRSAGTALLDVLNKVLDFSKLESGPLSLCPEVFAVKGLLDEVCSMVTPKAEAKHVSVLTRVAPGVPTQVRADPQYLRQVLLNLADNSVKFTQQGQVELSVVLDQQEGDVAYLRFKVRDTGQGIESQDQARLFHRFVQIDTTGRRFGGTGLGLAICRRLVESMGGAIGVNSRMGEGSIFWFTVPVEVVQTEPCVDTAARPAAPTVVSGLSILVVDDVDLNRHIIGEMLRPEHELIEYAADGAEALALWRAHHFDLILLDVHMPGLDGLEFVYQVRRYHEPARRDVPVIGVTASVDTEQCRSYVAAGMDAVLTKPFTKAQLVESITGLLKSALETRDTERALDAERRRRFLGKFVEVGTEYIAGLRDAVQAGGNEEVVFQAHRLAGAASMLGLNALAEAARSLEQAAKTSTKEDKWFGELFEAVDAQWRQVRSNVLGSAA